MATTSTPSVFATPTPRLVNGVTWIDLAFASNVAKGRGSIFVTDGAVQTVIDRVTGEPTLRVVGATFTKEISLDKVSIDGKAVSFDAGGLPPGAAMNVYMGAGTLLSGGKPVGAITVPGSAAFTAPTGDAPASLSATIALENKTLKAGADITVTVSFSEAVAFLDVAAIAAEHAGVKRMDHSTDKRTWTITLEATDSVESAANVLRLDMGQVSAEDGTRGNGTIISKPYAVDTIVDAYILPYLDINDAGPSYEDGVTNDNAQTMSGALMGEPAPDEHVELVINGDTIDRSRIRLVGEGDSWYWYYDPKPETGPTPTFKEGPNTVSVRLVNSDGHSSASITKTIIIDTDTPGIVAKPSGTVDAAQDISIGFDEAMYVNGDGEGRQHIEVVDGFGNTGWIALDDSMLSDDRKTLTLSPANHDLATGNSYRLYLPSGLTDLAGNAYEGPVIDFSTSGPPQDKAEPRLVQLYIVNGSGSYKTGDVLEFRLRYTEKINLAEGAAPVLYLDNGKVAQYEGLASSGTEMVFTYTVETDDHGDKLRYVDIDYTLYGNVQDDFGNVFQHAHVDYDGLSTADGYGAMVSFDTMAEQPGTPQLHADSEASAPGAGTTTDTRPRLTGAGAEAWASVTIYAGDAEVGAATADEHGDWDTVLTAPLSSGTHQLTVTQEDRAGNVSVLSGAFALTIVAAVPPPAPPLAAPVLAPGSDTGVSDSDRITQDDRPAIGGTGPANTTLTLKHNGVALTTITTDGSGNWRHTPSSLADGLHSFTVQQGDNGPVSPALTITVDRTRPSVGSAWDDLVTNVNPNGDLVITFSEAVHIAASEGDDDMLRLVDANGVVQKIVVSDANLSADKHTLTISAADHTLQALTDYRVHLPATLTDLAGMGIAEYEIRFTTGNDAVPGVARWIVGGDGSYRAGETVTIRVRFDEQVEKRGESGLALGMSNKLQAVFTGMNGNDEALFSFTVAPGNDYSGVLVTDTSQLAERFADLSGNLLDAAHIAFTSLTDAGGRDARIDIDTTAPATPNAVLLHPDSNSGSAADLLTSDRTPRLSGSGAEANAQVEIYKADALLGHGYADASGNWSASVDADRALGDGEHTLTVRLVDRAGNRSAASAALTVTVDATVAALDAPRLAAGHDTGMSPSDRITNRGAPTFVGSGAEAGARIELLKNGAVVGLGAADAGGYWSATLFAAEDGLADGAYSVSARQEDHAGNLGAASPTLAFTVDRTPPAAPGAAVLAPGSDSGTAGDGITRVRTPELSGGDALANARLVLYVDGAELGRPIADAAGNWTYVIPGAKALLDGAHSIRVTQLDAAGNESDFSPALGLRIDASLAAPGRPVLAAGSDSGISSKDGITRVVTPTFSGGDAEAGATVVLYAGAREIGRQTADDSGNWTLTVHEADKFTADNTYAITATQIDKTGMTSASSVALTLVIDTTAPILQQVVDNRLLQRYELMFGEKIVFDPDGAFKVLRNDNEMLVFKGNDGSDWEILAGAGGKHVLMLERGMNGTPNMILTNEHGIQDEAGNAAHIVGVRASDLYPGA